MHELVLRSGEAFNLRAHRLAGAQLPQLAAGHDEFVFLLSERHNVPESLATRSRGRVPKGPGRQEWHGGEDSADGRRPKQEMTRRYVQTGETKDVKSTFLSVTPYENTSFLYHSLACLTHLPCQKSTSSIALHIVTLPLIDVSTSFKLDP